MRAIIFYLLLLTYASSYSQKRLSQEAVNDVTTKVSSRFKFQPNHNIRSLVEKYLTSYNRSGPSAVIANLQTDFKGREDLLNLLNRATANRESLLRALLSINVEAKHAQEIADYLFPNLNPKKISAETSVAENPVTEELSVKELLKPIIWIPPSKKFFDGAKTFCDSSGKWHYTVTIMKSNVLLIKYPGRQSTNADQGTPVIKTKAVINGEEIVSARNYPSAYKYENNILYEKSEEENGWNKYVECASK